MLIVSREDAVRLKLQFFFTGVPCIFGHISQRYVNGRICRKCCEGRHREQVSMSQEARDQMKAERQSNGELL